VLEIESDEAEPNPDASYDRTIARAVELLVQSNPELRDGPPNTGFRAPLEVVTKHLVAMVTAVDRHDLGKLPHLKLAEWLELHDSTVRALLGRHPLIPRIQPTRAALELANAEAGQIRAGVVKVYAGGVPTTVTMRGVHQVRKDCGFQLHLELVVLTDRGRTVLVNTERFAVADSMHQQALDYATGKSGTRLGPSGQREPAASGLYAERVAEYYAEHWGRHSTGRLPQTIRDHVRSLVGGAKLGADLAGVPNLYDGMPILGGQLVTSTKAGPLPRAANVSLLSHDMPSVECLLDLGVFPILDLNYVDNEPGGRLVHLQVPMLLPDGAGSLVAQEGEQIRAVTESDHAQKVPRADLPLSPSERLNVAVTYVDGELDLSGTARPLRVYCVVSLRVPNSLYLVLMDPSDDATHRCVLPLILEDSLTLHAPNGPMEAARLMSRRKGAYDPGGKKADTTESLGAIARLAADRALHREQSHAR
jgi:hypothetical protein